MQTQTDYNALSAFIEEYLNKTYKVLPDNQVELPDTGILTYKMIRDEVTAAVRFNHKFEHMVGVFDVQNLRPEATKVRGVIRNFMLQGNNRLGKMPSIVVRYLPTAPRPCYYNHLPGTKTPQLLKTINNKIATQPVVPRTQPRIAPAPPQPRTQPRVEAPRTQPRIQQRVETPRTQPPVEQPRTQIRVQHPPKRPVELRQRVECSLISLAAPVLHLALYENSELRKQISSVIGMMPMAQESLVVDSLMKLIGLQVRGMVHDEMSAKRSKQ